MSGKQKISSYDVVVIGSGPAGQKAAIQSSKIGKKVLVVDKRVYKPGGVSLHTGTVPSKTLREAVLYLKGLKRKYVYGSSRYSREMVELYDLTEKVNSILNYEIKVIENQFRRNGIDILYGEASFVDREKISIKSEETKKTEIVSGTDFVIATGTIPRRPKDIEFDQSVVYDSDFIFAADNKREKLPESLIVYGAGVIGTEYSGMFAALGCDVTIIDRHKSIFPYIDNDIVNLLKRFYEDLNVKFELGKEYKKISRLNSGEGEVITVDGSVYRAEAILFSKGRSPAVSTLQLENAGVELNSNGTIKVDKCLRTTADHIFACGDVIGFPALASTSAEQGRLAARYLSGMDKNCRIDESYPFAIYSIPELSSIGLTEKELIEKNIPYEAGIAYYYEIAKAAISGDDRGALKILFHPQTKKIHGIHIIGDQAAEIIHIGQIVMEFDGTIEYFVSNIFNYPTWAEAYRVAAFNGLNRLK